MRVRTNINGIKNFPLALEEPMPGKWEASWLQIKGSCSAAPALQGLYSYTVVPWCYFMWYMYSASHWLPWVAS